MDRRGNKLDHRAGPYCRALLESGYELDFMAKDADPPLVIESEPGKIELFPTVCLLLMVPVRAPATKLPSPVQAECHATTYLELLAKEIEKGQSKMRDAYAEKCAETGWKMILQRNPEALRLGLVGNG